MFSMCCFGASIGHLYGEDVAVQSGVLTVGVNASNWSSHSGELPFVFGMLNGACPKILMVGNVLKSGTV